MTTATLGDTGIVLGGEPDDHGVRWRLLVGSDLWGPSPAGREVSGERAVAHGNWSATRFYGPRAWPASLTVTAPDHDALHHAQARLNAAIGLAPFLITGDEPHFGTRQAAYRRGGDVLWNETIPTKASASVMLIADDPLIRGELRTTSTGAPSSVGGLEWPATWPATWDAVVSSGRLALANPGTMPADVLWRIDGPITEPYLIDVATGRYLRTSLTLGAGEWLTIDTATHRVLANGDVNASRRDRVYGTWFTAAADTTTQVQFGGTSPGPGAQLTASWRPSWI